MNNRLSLLLIGCIFPFLSFYAQKNMNLPPYYPTVKGITDYAVWQLVYPDSLLKADIAGEVTKQGGKRRSAHMSILHCGHPDIRDFILAKSACGSVLSKG